MRRDKEEIIEFAKELYLTPNEEGNHKYSLQDICDEIKRKLNKNLTKATILNWSRKFGWDKLWEEAVRTGVTEALAKGFGEKGKEEAIKEAIAKFKKDKTIMQINLMKMAYKFIIENGFSSTAEAIKAFEVATKDLRDESLALEGLTIRVEFVKAPWGEDED